MVVMVELVEAWYRSEQDSAQGDAPARARRVGAGEHWRAMARRRAARRARRAARAVRRLERAFVS